MHTCQYYFLGFKENIFRLVKFLQVGGLPYVLNMALDQENSCDFENNAQNTK